MAEKLVPLHLLSLVLLTVEMKEINKKCKEFNQGRKKKAPPVPKHFAVAAGMSSVDS